MPLILSQTYRPHWLYRNNHFNTIYTALWRKIPNVSFDRERVETPDGDFVDADWSRVGSKKILLALHGLEGSSNSQYILGLTRLFNEKGWDVLAINFRGCSGEPNKKLQSYHMAATADLSQLVDLCLDRGYRRIALAGFSLGGNVVLRYLGEHGPDLSPQIKAAVAVSVPPDLPPAVKALHNWQNFLYMKNFVLDLNKKVKAKEQLLKENNFSTIYPKRLIDFDEQYTAPVHGFKDATDYYQRASSLPLIPNIRIPTLLINAGDDSFLTPTCFPIKLAEKLPLFYLEVPRWGGHVGFGDLRKGETLWSEQRMFSFLTDKINTG